MCLFLCLSSIPFFLSITLFPCYPSTCSSYPPLQSTSLSPPSSSFFPQHYCFFISYTSWLQLSIFPFHFSAPYDPTSSTPPPSVTFLFFSLTYLCSIRHLCPRKKKTKKKTQKDKLKKTTTSKLKKKKPRHIILLFLFPFSLHFLIVIPILCISSLCPSYVLYSNSLPTAARLKSVTQNIRLILLKLNEPSSGA